MTPDINLYWDERTLVIYGLLAGYTELEPPEISRTIKNLANAKGNVLFCLTLLANLEQAQRIKCTGIWLNLHKYLMQLEAEPNSDEIREFIGKVRDMCDWELDSTEVLIEGFAALLERKELATGALYGCMEFDVGVRGRKSLRSMVQSYLEQYHQNKLFSPTSGVYSSSAKQRVALLDYLDVPKPPKKISRFLLSTSVRLFEATYGLVDEGKMEITGFGDISEPDALEKLTFDIAIKTDREVVDEKRLAVEELRVEARNYEAANGLLYLAGERIEIIRQKNKKGSKESKQARLMRLLFNPYSFPASVAFKSIYESAYIDAKNRTHNRSVLKKAGQLAARINALVQEKIELNDLIQIDAYTFKINERYLKK